MSETRRLQYLAGKTGTIRAAKFNGTDHMVVPVVALVEGVVRPANSSGPELALASEFAHTPAAWNGRPVMVGHPTISGIPVSAGDPRILESESVGQIFKASSDGTQLEFEAWVDTDRAKALGGDAEAIVTRLEAGEQLEVSVGAFVNLEEKTGSHNGAAYQSVWRDVLPDHIALLREGETGACSIDMGCGAPRAASSKEDPEDAIPTEPAAIQFSEENSFAKMARWLTSLLGIRSAISDTDRREQLTIALRRVENELWHILAVDETERTVVYTAWDDGSRTFRRTFEVNGDDVTLSEEKEEVRAETRFIAAVAADSGCACGRTASLSTEGDESMTREQRIQALIENTESPWSEDERPFLTALSDAKLEAFEQSSGTSEPHRGAPSAPEPAATPAPAATPSATPVAASAAEPAAPPAAPDTPVTAEAYIDAAPPEVREVLNESIRVARERKDSLVKTLAGSQDAYTEEELKAMNAAELERLLKVAKVAAPPHDFSGRGLPRPEPTFEGDGQRMKALTWGDFKKKETAAAS